MKMKGYVAIGRDGVPRVWTVSSTRRDTMKRATETMMPASEYQRLLTVSDRWSYCYRRGCRIVPATVEVKP